MANSTQYTMYANVPTIQISRSRQNLSHHVKGSINLGELRPFYLQEVYAGDTIKCKTNFQCRLASALGRPLMDNLFIDTYYFFVPHRLTYEHWEEVMGDNKNSSWIPQQVYKFPVTEQNGTISKNSIADSFGLPVGNVPKGIQVAPFRGFAKIYNEWFRDQNTIDPVYVHEGDIVQSEMFNDQAWSENNYTGMPPKVSKFHDVFTSALPSPQKGEPVLVSLNGFIPLDSAIDSAAFESGHALNFLFDNGNSTAGAYNLSLGGNVVTNSEGIGQFDVEGSSESTFTGNGKIIGTNLGINGEVAGITVNDLRLAFATQRLLERSATYGTRYREILKSAFGVDSPDARMQVPEFLGGKRSQLDIGEVWQTSSSIGQVSPTGLDNFLGTSAAFSKTNENNGFTKSFVEHGYVIGVYCIRQHHSYTQGIEKFWSRTERLDFYDPAFANIGLQPIYQSELYADAAIQADGIGGENDNVFGYTEAWYDLRSRPNIVTGELKPSSLTGLDAYTLADIYDEPPVLSKEFLEEHPNYLDRSLTVKSTDHQQFVLDFYHSVSAIRPLPVRSIPTDLGGAHR